MYSDKFYYFNKLTAQKCSYTPSGFPDVNELIKSKPYWRVNDSVKKLQKKTLIFADWTSYDWKEEKIQAVIFQLKKLLDDGFEIYYWNRGQLKLLNKGNLLDISQGNFRHLPFPSLHTSIIDEAFKQKKLIKDNIHILDDYEIGCLINPNTANQPRKIKAKQLNRTNYKVDTLALLATIHPKIEILQNFDFNSPSIENFLLLKAKFPNLPTESTYQALYLIKTELDTLINTGELTFKTETFTEQQLAGIEDLSIIRSEVSSRNVSAILEKIKRLKSLNLSGCSELRDDITQHLPELENLIISRGSISEKNIIQLLSDAPHLKSILLIGYKNIASIPPLSLNFSQLEHFDLRSSNMEFLDLDTVLASTTALKSLTLEECTFASSELKKTFHFPDLVKLEISLNLSPQSIYKIISAAPNLKQLSIAGNINFTESLLPADLSSIETLTMNYNSLNIVEFQNFLAKMPNLQQITIESFSPLINNDFKGVPLPALTVLVLNQNISSQNLQQLLSHAPNLRTVEFLEANVNWQQALNSVTFDFLESLTMQDCNVDVDTLKKIIKNAPNLSYLSVNCPALIMDEELDNLLRLRRLDKYAPTVESTQPDSKTIIPIEKNIPPSKAVTGHSECKIDADTRLDKEKEFNIQRIFYPVSSNAKLPDYRLDRLEVFNNLWINPKSCSINDAFAYRKEGDLKLIPVKPKRYTEDVFAFAKTLKKPDEADYFYGKQQLALTTEWQALASLSPSEELTHFHLEPDVDIEIQYSLRDNQYYIRSKKPQTVAIDFLLKVPSTKSSPPMYIQELINQFKQFGSEELEILKQDPNGNDFLSYIVEQENGACRHRCVAFKNLLEKLYPELPTRIILNECHAFIEIAIDDQWIHCDLGGYPSKVNIQEENNPHDESRSLINHFIKQLETWTKSTPLFDSVKEYCQHLLQPNDINKCLVELASDSDIEALQLSLQAYCQSTSRPVYYINSPDDLICSAPFIKRSGNQGQLKEGPGGRLHDFLQAHQTTSPAPVLLVNYAHFKADDLVRFNALLDDLRHADGSPLPKHMKVIGLINPNKPDAYLGEDFYSRFDVVETSPLKSVLLEQAKPVLPVIPKEDTTKVAAIDLYHASDWKERLLGRWVPQNDNLYFIDGELTAALASGLPIELKNAPWEDPEFVSFWQQALLHKKIEHADRTLTLPTNLKLVQQEGYEWSLLRQQLTLEAGINPKAEVLNPSRLSLFFNQYQCDNPTKKLKPILGIIEQQANGILSVNLTAPLSDDEWAMVLNACQKHHVELVCHVVPSVSLPSSLTEQPWPQPTKTLPTWQGELTKTMVLSSSDIDTSVAMLTSQGNDWLVIDVSECRSSDLLIALDGKLNKSSLRFEFNQSERALLNALVDKKNVIIKGRFSDELIDSLAPLLIQRQHSNEANGQLVLVSDNPNAFNYLQTAHHPVTVQEKQFCLEKQFTAKELAVLTEKQLTQEPLSQLQARLHFHATHPNKSTEDAWKGLYHLPVHFHLPDFDAVHSKEKAQAFIDARLQGVNQILSTQPYAFLSGLTAVGKSTFVDTYLNDDNNVLYKGEEKMIAWANDTSNARKILFIDEATIENRGWSEFEGLFNNPPGIVIQGAYYPLTDKHKVIFASNPLSYGGERQLAPLFARHGNALLFEPMPLEFIYEVILKPVFENTPLAADPLAIALPLFKVYRFLCENSQNEVLISTRELQMMSLLALSAYQNNTNLNPTELAEHYAFELGKTLVPENLKETFLQQFMPFNPLPPQKVENSKPSEFLITRSRQAIRQQLDELLQLRRLRQNATNSTQKYGGINGIILEGEPGIGKSELVIATLLQHGYKKVILNQEKQAGNIFYHMPVSMQFEDKKKLLLKAFDEGAVVIIDEINSSPMMERLLNDLLMGKTPDGGRPTTPGFLIIGTQNPPTMAGRINPSNALARRLIQTHLESYNAAEMHSILCKKDVEPTIASTMAQAYNICIQKAKQFSLSPFPTFRDLLKVAKRYLAAHKQNNKEEIDEIKVDEAKTKTHEQLSHIDKEPITTELKAKTPTLFPESYEGICKQHDSPLDKAWALLLDYTKKNSFISRFFHGHLNRHYVKEVNAIVKERSKITDIHELMQSLKEIKMPHPPGSLAKRIQYIEENLVPLEQDQIQEINVKIP